MLRNINPSQTDSWRKLSDHYHKIEPVHMKDLFAADPDRFKKFSFRFKDLLVDCSKNRITEETLGLLIGLAGETGVKEAIASMFNGRKYKHHRKPGRAAHGFEKQDEYTAHRGR